MESAESPLSDVWGRPDADGSDIGLQRMGARWYCPGRAKPVEGLLLHLRNPLVAAMAGAADYANRAEVNKLVNDALAALDLPEDFVRPGDRVILKPNWVKEHDERNPGPDQWEHCP